MCLAIALEVRVLEPEPGGRQGLPAQGERISCPKMSSAARSRACVTCKAKPSQCIVMVWYNLRKCTMAFLSSFHERSGVRRKAGPAQAPSLAALGSTDGSWLGFSLSLLLAAACNSCSGNLQFPVLEQPSAPSVPFPTPTP